MTMDEKILSNIGHISFRLYSKKKYPMWNSQWHSIDIYYRNTGTTERTTWVSVCHLYGQPLFPSFWWEKTRIERISDNAQVTKEIVKKDEIGKGKFHREKREGLFASTGRSFRSDKWLRKRCTHCSQVTIVRCDDSSQLRLDG